jgi:hypothetical protein
MFLKSHEIALQIYELLLHFFNEILAPLRLLNFDPTQQ